MALKPRKRVTDEREIDYVIKDVQFELIIADADTPLFKAAKSVQEDYVVINFKRKGAPFGIDEDDPQWKLVEGKYTAEFPNKTKFYGQWQKKQGGWLAGFNAMRIEEGYSELTHEDFDIEECTRLSDEIDDHLAYAVEKFDYFVGRLKKAVKAEDYLLCIGGSGNFRYDVAHLLPYKGERKDKPLLFQETKEAIIAKYKSHIEVVDDEEADDRLGQYGWENYKHFKKTGVWKYVLSYIDKDLDMILSPSFNYDNVEAGITYTTELDGARFFCAQLLSGDKSTDNIGGLPKFTDEIVEKYSLRKSKGVGKATALEFITDCETIKEMFERVVEAYKSYYGDSYKFTSHRGEGMEYSWLDCLQENAVLLHMRRHKDEIINMESVLNRLGIL